MTRRYLLALLAVAGGLWLGGCGSGGEAALTPLDQPGGEISRAKFSTDAAGQARVIIRFRPGAIAASRDLVAAAGGKVEREYSIVPAAAARVPLAAVEALLRNPNIEVVEPDVQVKISDAELDAVWGVKLIGSGTVHTGGNVGAGIKVAVIDTGIDYTHPDLDGNYAGGWDFVNNDSDPMDDNGHGTHVAGTIGAEDNSVGVVGVAPGARLYAVKVLDASGGGWASTILAGVQWATQNGMQITNHSYGTTSDLGSTMKAAYDAAWQAGILQFAAAGNYGTADGSGDNICYPARYDSVIAVTSTTSADGRSSFSCTGAAAELAAPGSSIKSTLRGGTYGNYSGTSMASPHAAGAAALCLKANWSAAGTRTRLQQTAKDLGAAGRDPWFGFGRIDAAAAASGSGDGGGSGTLPPPPPPPPPTTGSISGYVKDATSLAVVAGATVKADTGQTTTTDAAGYFLLNAVPTGTRTITAAHRRYFSSSLTLSLTTSAAAEFRLKRKK